MPSSSKHETCQEQRLAYWFKVTHAHLYYAHLHKHASTITSIFCQLLECTQKDLLQSLRSDSEWWDKLAKHCKEKSTSDNVWAAADQMADAAACLFEFGRKKEGGQFCEWAEELRELAIEEYEYEQKRKRSTVYEIR